MSNELKEVDFYGDKLTAVKGEDGKTYVGLRQMVENLGLDVSSQTAKVMSNPLLSPTVAIIATVAKDGNQENLYV